MPPVLERLVALAVGILLCLLLLSEVTLAVGDHTTHVLQIIFVVARPIPTGVVLQDFDDLPAAGCSYQFHPSSNVDVLQD